MDPNQVLFELREMAALADDLERVDPHMWAEKFGALDEWLTKGGFPPADWAPVDPEPTSLADVNDRYLNQALLRIVKGGDEQ